MLAKYIYSNKIEEVTNFYKQHGLERCMILLKGSSPIHLAVKFNNKEMLRALHKNGCSLNTPSRFRNEVPQGLIES